MLPYFALILTFVCHAHALSNATISITFNETLKGFSAPGGNVNDTIKDFQVAYEIGKLSKEIMSFSLQVDIADVVKWHADPLHNAVCAGHVIEAAITNMSSVPVGADGSLHVFDGGVHHKTHELMMEYSLPFVEKGRNYTLYGVKHMPGNDCLALLSQATTLYVHVFDDAHPETILRTGIVKIGAGDIISLVESMRVHGGTVADQIKGFLTFGLLLVTDILENCLSIAANENKFWYVWANDGNTGFLLDLIKRPDTLELRLAQYIGNSSTNETSSVTVHRQLLPLNQFSIGKDNVTVHFGDVIQMSPTGVVGTVDGIEINVTWSFNSRTNVFFPPELAVLKMNAVLPEPTSQYGEIGNYPSGGTIGGHVLKAAVPVVRTNYNIPFGLDSELLKWSMISASQFTTTDGTNEGVDLQIEMVAMPLRILPFLPPSTWVAPTYLQIDGTEYHLNSLEACTELISVVSDGRLTADNRHRIFAVEIQLPAAESGAIHVSLNCTSPVNDFAMLDQEGKTYIHSTVRGTCRAEVTKMDDEHRMTTVSYISVNKNLLEIKN